MSTDGVLTICESHKNQPRGGGDGRTFYTRNWKKNIYEWTVNMYDILTVQNALIIYVH